MQDKITITFIICIFRISKATDLANQSLEDNTKLSLMLYSIFCTETSFLERELTLFDEIAYKQIYPLHLQVLAFPDKINS